MACVLSVGACFVGVEKEALALGVDLRIQIGPPRENHIDFVSEDLCRWNSVTEDISLVLIIGVSAAERCRLDVVVAET